MSWVNLNNSVHQFDFVHNLPFQFYAAGTESIKPNLNFLWTVTEEQDPWTLPQEEETEKYWKQEIASKIYNNIIRKSMLEKRWKDQ